MKILIIALPRTGSTNLLNTLSVQHNIKSMFEPFDGTNRFNYHKDIKNVVVKTIVEQQPNESVSYIDFIINLIKEFDEVILLSRKDLKACSESHAYCVFNKNNNFNSVTEYYWEPTPIDELCYSNVIKWNDILIEISKLINIPITYYEDLYDINSNKKLRKGNISDITKSLI